MSHSTGPPTKRGGGAAVEQLDARLARAGPSLITRSGHAVAARTADAERRQFLPRADTIKNPVSLRREAHLGEACR